MTPPAPRTGAGLTYLRNGQFARLFGSRLITNFGSVMSPIAIAFGVLQLTGSAQQTSLVVAAQVTAQVLVLLFGGALADRGHRQRILVGADLLAAGSQAAVAALFLSGHAHITLLVLLAATNGAASGLNLPTMTGFITQVVPREHLRDANALLASARSASVTLGAALAGVMVATIGAGWTIAVDALTYTLSALLVSQVRANEQILAQRDTLLRSLREGWSEFMAHRWLWVVVLQFAFVVAGVQAFYGLIGPTIAQRQLGGSADWGIIAAAFGAGTLVGGLVVLRLTIQRPMRVAVLCVFAGALPMLLATGPAPVFWLALGTFVHGIFAQTFGVLWNTTVQRRIAPEAMSRVSAYDYLGSICCAPLGVIGAGWMLDHLDFRVTLLVAMVLVVVPTAAALCVREVRDLGPD